MSISASSPSSMGDDETLALCTLARVAAAIVVASVLAHNGLSGGEPWIAIGAGAVFGGLAPRRWRAAIAGAAAASVAAMAAPGTGAPAAALLVLPGAFVGSWLRARPEPAHPVAWLDAVLIGAGAEVVIVVNALLVAFAIGLLVSPVALLGPMVWWLVAGVLVVAGCGWMHVWYGRAIDRMLPERFAGFALGQVLPIAVLAITGDEPLVLLVVAIRSLCLWWGHLLAEAEAVGSGPPQRITVSPGRRRAGTFR